MGTSEILYVKRITVLFLAVLFLGTTSIIKAVPGNAGEALNDLLPHFVSHAGPDSVSRHKRTNIYSSDSLFSFRSRKGYFPSLLHNTAEQAAAPFHFRKKELFLSGSVVLLTAGLTCSDGLTDDYTKVLKSRHEWIRRASPVITSFGSRSGYGTVIVFGTMSAIFKNKKGVETSFLVSQALLTSGLWVQVIKILAGRQRPFRYDITGSSVAGHWYGPFAQYRNDLAKDKPGAAFESFPSGHTATAFSIATVFAMQYSDKKAIPVISYSAATLVGISRLTEHRHWLSDVFAGAVLGYFCGRQVVNHHRRLMENTKYVAGNTDKIQSEFSLTTSGNQLGLKITW